MDWENDSFTVVAQNVNYESPFGKDIDVSKISKTITDTTDTMYSDIRYIDLTQEQLDELQENN